MLRPPRNRRVTKHDAFDAYLRQAGPGLPEDRVLATPPAGGAWAEVPARSVEYSSPGKYLPRRRVEGTEQPLEHVYRGMSGAEWQEAQERGFIQSDQRGVIDAREGTNFGTDPRTAASYVPRGDTGSVIASVRVEPEDPYFAIAPDSYVRTREPVPVDRVEGTLPLQKDDGGRFLFPLPDRTPRFGRTLLNRGQFR